MREASNKERILKLQEIFERETDEHHELSFADIIKRLKLEYGADYKIGLRAIKDDIKILRMNEETYLIENTDKFGKKLYSKQNRKFETYQLRILIDAVYSARFITPVEAERIVESNDGNYYDVKPYGLVWNNGFYYLVGHNLEKEKIINYRVDRMRKLHITNQGFQGVILIWDSMLANVLICIQGKLDS